MLDSVLAIVAALAGCSQTVSFALPTDTPVRITAGAHQHIIAPSDPRYSRLREWLARNQRWSPLFATNPSGGIIVTAGDLWLQFVGATAFTGTHDGLLQKEVQPDEYAFL